MSTRGYPAVVPPGADSADSDAIAARPTSADVAKLAGVSISAVSLALNNRPGVSESTRRRILWAAEHLNWLPNQAARSLRGAGSDVVGLVVSRPASTLGVEPFFAKLLSGIQGRLSRDGVAFQMLIVEDADGEIATYRRWAAERRIGGTVLLDLRADDPRPAAVAALRIPAVTLGGSEPVPGISAVRVDDYAAMASLVSHLATLGHRRIAHIAGTTAFLHTAERSRALHDLAAELDLVVLAVPTDYSDHQAAAATRSLLGAQQPPSAIVYDNDVMTVAGLKVAAEMGVAVPRQLSLASFDDSVLTELTHPALTSLSRDTAALGELVAAELIRLMADPSAARRTQAPTPHLVVRGSTASPVS